VRAIQAVTINAAQLLKRARYIGSISPGRAADILVVSDITKLKVDDVYSDGVHVAHNGELVVDVPPPVYPPWSLNSVHVAPVTSEDFRIFESSENLLARVIRVSPGQIQTSKQVMDIFAAGGEVAADPGRDLLKLFVFHRHPEKEGVPQKAYGMVTGTLFGPDCAYAATLGHDSHNLVVIGSSDQDMALATNRVIELQGGVVAVRGGRVVADLPLPLAGLMSLEPIDVVIEKIQDVNTALVADQEGFDVTGHLVFLSLVCIPQLHLSNRGLVELGLGAPPQFVTPFYPDGRFSPRGVERPGGIPTTSAPRQPVFDPFAPAFDPFADSVVEHATGKSTDPMLQSPHSSAPLSGQRSTSNLDVVPNIFGPAPAGIGIATPNFARQDPPAPAPAPPPEKKQPDKAPGPRRPGAATPNAGRPPAMAQAAQRFAQKRVTKAAAATPAKRVYAKK
jgi:hypothetical protein